MQNKRKASTEDEKGNEGRICPPEVKGWAEGLAFQILLLSSSLSRPNEMDATDWSD